MITKMSLKSRDKHNRWRNRTISFRMSDEENKLLDRYVKMFYNCTNRNSTVIKHGGNMKQIFTKHTCEHFAFLKELLVLFWRKCGISALILNLGIDSLCGKLFYMQ